MYTRIGRFYHGSHIMTSYGDILCGGAGNLRGCNLTVYLVNCQQDLGSAGSAAHKQLMLGLNMLLQPSCRTLA